MMKFNVVMLILSKEMYNEIVSRFVEAGIAVTPWSESFSHKENNPCKMLSVQLSFNDDKKIKNVNDVHDFIVKLLVNIDWISLVIFSNDASSCTAALNKLDKRVEK